MKKLSFIKSIGSFFFFAFFVLLVSCGNSPNSPKDFSYTKTDDGTGIKITAYVGKKKNVIIPAMIENLPVKEVEAFDNFDQEGSYYSTLLERKVKTKWNSFIKKVVFPDSVETIPFFCGEPIIGYGGFYTALEYVKLPASLKQGHIFVPYEPGKEDEIYIYDPKTKEKLPNRAKEFGMDFSYLKSLKTIVIPEGIKYIDNLQGTSLKSIELPSTIRFIGYSAFVSSYGSNPVKTLTSVTVPDSVQNICFSANDYNGMFSWDITDEPKINNCFLGTSLDLKTQDKLKSLGYNGSF